MHSKTVRLLIAISLIISVLVFSFPNAVYLNANAISVSMNVRHPANQIKSTLEQEKYRAAHALQNFARLIPDIDYVGQEICISAASEKEARKAATAYNGEVIEFHPSGSAVIRLAKSKSVVEAVTLGADLSNQLPVAYPNFIYKIDDLSVGLQDAVIPADQQLGNQPYHTLIGSHDAWAVSQGSADVVVAVIDTGIDTDHPEFTGRISPLSYNTTTNATGVKCVEADVYHGTHVAGIIAAAQGNAFGGSGIAPASTLLVIKANMPDDPNAFTSYDLVEAIYYAANHGADIINLSLGRPYQTGSSGTEQIAIQYALDKGVLVICAAGNESYAHAGFPAAYPETLAVSAANTEGVFNADFSNYGPEIDLCAPGTDIYSTIPDKSFTTYSGTSMACPMVSGLAALLLSCYPGYTPDQIKDLMFLSATDLGDHGFDPYYGNGLIHVGKALDPQVSQIYFEGAGTEADPFLIASPLQLMQMADLVNLKIPLYRYGFYKLTADLDLSGFSNWTPIGCSPEQSFWGTFDGDGNVITCLNIVQSVDNPPFFGYFIGLFGHITGTVKNICLTDANITITGSGNSCAGGIAGKIYPDSLVTHCHFSGKIIGSATFAGGIAGINNGEITWCSNSGDIQGLAHTGGIAGSSTSISDCFNTGMIEGTTGTETTAGGICGENLTSVFRCFNRGPVFGQAKYTGGIAGKNFSQLGFCHNSGKIFGGSSATGGLIGSSTGWVNDCYNSGDVVGTGYAAGGLFGLLAKWTASQTYNTGAVSGTGSCIGGFAGHVLASAVITDSYDLETSVPAIGLGSGPITRCTQEQMQQISTFTGFDFSAVWQLPGNNAYPTPVLTKLYNPVQQTELVDQEMLVGTRTCILTTLPAQSTIPVLIWEYDPDIIDVDQNGYVTALSAGTTAVRCTSASGDGSAVCQVTVRQGVTGINMPDQLVLEIGDTQQLQPEVGPSDCDNQQLIWCSSNPLAASVDQNGLVQALLPGFARITAVAADGSGTTASCAVTTLRRVSGMTLSVSQTYIHIGKKLRVLLSISPADASNIKVSWSSSDPKLATVDATGVVTGIACGQVMIRAVTEDGSFEDAVTVTIVQPATGIQVNPAAASVLLRRHIQLAATVLPANAWQAITWSSSNVLVATVDSNGLVTGNGTGTAEITARSVDGGFSASCTLSVVVGVEEIIIEGASEVVCDQIASYTAAVLPADAANKAVAWSVENRDGMAEINAAGELRAISSGQVIIRAASVDGTGITAQKAVTIKQRCYEVIFVDWDNRVLKTELVAHSQSATAPSDPTRDGFIFTGWNQPYINVTGPLVIQAQYSELETRIRSDQIAINYDKKLMGPMSEKTTIAALLPKLTNQVDKLVVKDRNGLVIIDHNLPLATGMTIMIDGQPDSELTIAVKGDLNGDGAISALDLLQMKKHLLGQINLEGAYREAAFVTGNSAPSALDLLQIKKHLLGQIIIK